MTREEESMAAREIEETGDGKERRRAVSRRSFMALAGGSAAAVSLLSACGDESNASEETGEFGDGDIGVLNFLLTLEYLEAAFYKDLVNSTLFDAAERKALGKFGKQEEEHIAALVEEVEKLGGDPAAPVKTKFSLETNAATLELASELENLGAAAYLGQLAIVESASAQKKLIEIHTVEGRHAAAINYLLKTPVTPDGAFAKPAKAKDVLAAVKPYMAV
jgi:rubrerythrin